MSYSNMKHKFKALFISIALSFLIGCIAKANLYTSETVKTPFGSLAETVYFQDSLLDREETSVSKHNILSELNNGNALRHFPQTKRINSSSSSKLGLVSVKRNPIQYFPPLILESYRRFPSGLTEARLYLISLGKLII